MMEGAGTTPSSAFRRKLFRPCAAAAIESETTFDDLGTARSSRDGRHDDGGPDTLDDEESTMGSPPPAVVGGVAVVGAFALFGASALMLVAALVAAAAPASGQAHLLGLP